MIRVRFAPSPTGYLHVGGARTALFNWLFARRHGGTFVLRIEDTDAERSSWEMVAGIVDGLRWLGARLGRGAGRRRAARAVFPVGAARAVREQAERLVATGTRTIATARRRSCSASAPTEAGRRGRTIAPACALTADERRRLERGGTPRAIRFQVPAGKTRSTISCTARSSSTTRTSKTSSSCARTGSRPITCRSWSTTSTWRSRTSSAATITSRTRRSRCCSIRRSAAAAPQFAHVPLILGPDKKRLSKRHGATSVMEYQRLGYLPEAMVNFLALLGWSPGGDREVLTRDELDRSCSRSKGSAAATPSSIPRSWTGSTSSTSPGCRRTSSLAADRAPAARGGALARRRWTRRSRVDRPGARAPEAARQEARSARRRAAAVPRGAARDRSGGGGEASDGG